MKLLAGLVGLIILVSFVGPGFLAILFVLWLATSLLNYSTKE